MKNRIELSKFQRQKKELAKLYREMEAIEEQDLTPAAAKTAMQELSARIDAFIEGPYSQQVFEYYSRKKPNLVRIRTGEIFSWSEAFGESFEKTTKSQRHALVGLVEGGSRYRLK